MTTFTPALLIFSSGCLVGGVLGNGDRDELDAQRDKWRQAEISSYVYREDRSCFCAFFGPADVSVVNGEIVAVRRFVPDTVDVNPTDFQYYDTVDGLFEMVLRAIAADAHRLDVDYDEQFGFPTRIAVDYIENAVDDEITITATLFAPAVN